MKKDNSTLNTSSITFKTLTTTATIVLSNEPAIKNENSNTRDISKSRSPSRKILLKKNIKKKLSYDGSTQMNQLFNNKIIQAKTISGPKNPFDTNKIDNIGLVSKLLLASKNNKKYQSLTPPLNPESPEGIFDHSSAVNFLEDSANNISWTQWKQQKPLAQRPFSAVKASGKLINEEYKVSRAPQSNMERSATNSKMTVSRNNIKSNAKLVNNFTGEFKDGIGKELGRPEFRNFIKENKQKSSKHRKDKSILKDGYFNEALNKTMPYVFDIMNKYENSIDGFYGDWGRDEFNMTRSRYKIETYNKDRAKRKYFSKLYPQLPKNFLNYKLKKEPLKVNKLNQVPIISSKNPKQSILFKYDNKISLSKESKETNQDMLLYQNQDSVDGSDNQENHKKNPVDGYALQFPLIEFAKIKYGGIDLYALRKQASDNPRKNLAIGKDDKLQAEISHENNNKTIESSTFLTESYSLPKNPQTNNTLGYNDDQTIILDNMIKKEITRLPNEYSTETLYLALPIPISESIFDNGIKVISYPIRNNHIGEIIGKTLANKALLTMIILIDNQMNDDISYQLFHPIRDKLDNLKIFKYCNNIIGCKTAKLISEALFFEDSINLREFSLDSCQITQYNLSNILERLYSYKIRLARLSLSNIGLKDISLKLFYKIISNNDFLRSIDISKNNLNRDDMFKIIDAILQNPNLQFLNISNNLIGTFDTINNIQTSDNKDMSLYTICLMKAYLAQHPSLIHINLSNTGLKAKDIQYLLHGIRLSYSIQAIHLSGNHMDEYDIIEFSNILQIKNIKKNMENNITLAENNNNSIKTSNSESSRNRYSEKPLVFYRICDENSNNDPNIWKIDESCWICDKWHKINVEYKVPIDGLEDPAISKECYLLEAKRNNQRLKNISKNMVNLQERPKKLKDDIKYYIKGSFTSNIPLEMRYNEQTNVFEYIDYAYPTKHWYIIERIEKDKEDEKTLVISNEIIIKPRNKEIQIKKFSCGNGTNNSNGDDGSSNNHKNGDCGLNSSDDQLTTKIHDYFYKKKFIFSRSIFRDFRVENENLYKSCLDAEWKYIKISQMIKKPDEIKKIKDHIQKIYKIIQDIFLYWSIQSTSYPALSYENFLKICKNMDYLDLRITLAEVDRVFVATKILDDNQEKYDFNCDKALCRHEFIEVLIRLAIMKYFDNKSCKTHYEAWEKFYTKNLLKIQLHDDNTNDKYRHEHIYNIKIDELFKLNIHIFDKFYKINKRLAGINFESLKKLLIDCDIKLTELEFINIVAYSKMIHVDEIHEARYQRCLLQVELIEFIVRLADHLYNSEEIPLYAKVQKLLQLFFNTINEHVIKLDDSM